MDERIKGIVTTFTLFLLACMLVFGYTKVSAQSVKRQGNTFIEQKNDTTKTKKKCQVYETDYLYVEPDGKAYNIFLSSSRKAFIEKTSKKSGRKYRKYLPEVTKMIQNENK